MDTFTLMPMSQDIELVAGETYHGTIKVANPVDATEDFYYAISVTPYSVMGEEYTENLVTQSNSTMITDWIKIEEPTGKIKPNETKTIHFSIDVPEMAPAGGQYATLSVRSNKAAAEENGIAIKNTYEMASVIFARVSGETVHEGAILTNSIPGFVTDGAAVVQAEIVNSGNVHELAEVTVEVKNAMNGDAILPRLNEANVYTEMIMPGTTRHLSRAISDLPALGVFEVTQNIAYMGRVSPNTVTVVMCPLWFLLLSILTVGAIIGTALGMIFRHRKQKKVL